MTNCHLLLHLLKQKLFKPKNSLSHVSIFLTLCQVFALQSRLDYFVFFKGDILVKFFTVDQDAGKSPTCILTEFELVAFSIYSCAKLTILQTFSNSLKKVFFLIGNPG